MNHFGDGGGGNDHTILSRGDMPFIYTVNLPITIITSPTGGRSRHSHGCFGSDMCFILYIATKKYYVK